MPSIPINIEFDKKIINHQKPQQFHYLGKPSEILKIMIINPAGKIIGEDIGNQITRRWSEQIMN